MSNDPKGEDRLNPIIDAALHRYFSRVTRRYVPVLVAVVVLGVVVVGLPSRPDDPDTDLSTDTADVDAGPGDSGVGSQTTPTQPGGVIDPTGGTTGGTTGGPQTTTPGAPGVARSGVTCGPGVLQVTWTPYAPPCTAAFTGSNGGATAPGVTGSEITVVLRTTTDTEANNASSGVSFAQRVADLQKFVDLFNKTYELYGRKVVLRSFTGRGSFLNEASGQGQAGAQSDAQTAKDMGAFASIDGFAPFQAALADRKIIGFGAPYAPKPFYEQYSPYVYGDPRWMMGLDWGQATAAIVCDRMATKPAVFAGDDATRSKTRVFGLTTINDPNYAEGGAVFEQTASSRCGAKVVQRSEYKFDTTQAQQAVQIVSKMKAAGVTTLVHAGDPLMFAQLSLAADQQNWHPEYIGVDPTATIGRIGAKSQMASALVVTPFAASPGYSASSEAGRVFRIASGGAAPVSGSIDFAGDYMYLLQLFNGLQAAGPNLTAESFRRGFQNLGDRRGEFGLWRSAQPYSLPGDFVVSRWNPNTPNAGDGKVGDFVACDGGTRYPLNPKSAGSGQLSC